jgi:hypothetical protein
MNEFVTRQTTGETGCLIPIAVKTSGELVDYH